jgi:hypothetical protein
MQLDHPGAGAGRRNDIVEVFERRDDGASDSRGIAAIAGIVGGLPATDLQGRYFDGAAGIFQELYGGETDARPEQIDQTGHKECNALRPRARGRR